MARGYPDFFSMPIFPTRGVSQHEFITPIVVPAGTSGLVVDIAGKGSMLGGYVTIEGSLNFANMYLNPIIDGMPINRIYPLELFNARCTNSKNGLFFIVRLDYSASVWAFGISGDLDFGLWFNTLLVNDTALDLTVTSRYDWFRVV